MADRAHWTMALHAEASILTQLQKRLVFSFLYFLEWVNRLRIEVIYTSLFRAYSLSRYDAGQAELWELKN